MLLLYNLLLAVIWAVLTGRFTLGNFVLGIIIGYFILLSIRGAIRSRYPMRVGRAIALILFFVGELLRANLRMIPELIRPAHRARPAVVDVPLDTRSDFETVSLALMLTLSPDTLALDVSKDRKSLRVYSLDTRDPEAFREQVKSQIERRIIEVTR